MSKNRIIPYNKHLKQFARKLRSNSTKAEKEFWSIVRRRALGVQFHRQVPIDKYIVDFYCHEISVAIELDGNSHFNEEAKESDQVRDAKLKEIGITVVRFTDTEVFDDTQNMTQILERIIAELTV